MIGPDIPQDESNSHSTSRPHHASASTLIDVVACTPATILATHPRLPYDP